MLIVDDEPLALRRLARMLSRIEGFGDIMSSSNVHSALEAIHHRRPDVVFLDVEMPTANGFELLELIETAPMPAVVFTTAYENYARRAFDVKAIDYLTKPFSQERLAVAVSRLMESFDADNARRELRRVSRELDASLASAPSGFAEHLWVSTAHGRQRISVHAIWLLTAEGDYVRLHHDQGELLWKGSLAKLAECLNPRSFQRCHRSSIVKLDEVRGTYRNKGGREFLIMRNGQTVAVSRTYKANLAELRH